LYRVRDRSAPGAREARIPGALRPGRQQGLPAFRRTKSRQISGATIHPKPGIAAIPGRTLTNNQ